MLGLKYHSTVVPCFTAACSFFFFGYNERFYFIFCVGFIVSLNFFHTNGHARRRKSPINPPEITIQCFQRLLSTENQEFFQSFRVVGYLTVDLRLSILIPTRLSKELSTPLARPLDRVSMTLFRQ